LQALYKSLGLIESNFMSAEEVVAAAATTSFLLHGKKSVDDDLDLLNIYSNGVFRKDALHLFGVDELSTNDVFDYFKSFKPFAVEWINDSSCNVIWRNEVHAANALLGTSIEYNESSESLLKQEENVDDKELNKQIILSKFHKRKPSPLFKWRKGLKSIKNHQIYIRYMRKTDKKKKGAESKSKYYVKYGNPNYGNIKGNNNIKN
jgi:hypothetical protein